MRKRPLGKTGIEVSELSLGTWGLSGDGYGPMVEAEVDRVIDRALAAGIDLFDTADVYGKGSMERRLGERLPAASTYVATKIGTDLTIVPPQKRFDLDYLRPAFEASRDRLRRETLDIVLLHNPTMLAMSKSEPFDFLKELKRLGAVRAWGVSAGTAEVARAAIRHGAEVIELAYNVFVAADLHGLRDILAESGVAVLARSVLAHGLLAGQWSPEREFYDGDHRNDRWTANDLKTRIGQLDALRPLVTGPVLSVRAAALRFVLANAQVSSAVLGPRSVAQLDQLVREAGSGPPYLRDTALAELSARLRAVGVVV
ncbi:Aldo-keto reductase [Minicystis rosea]|nr:Aldo-keto reductase [Minicystis rosea]